MKSNGFLYLAVTSGRSIFKNISMNWTHNLWKFGEDITTQTRMVFSYTWKSPKNALKSKCFLYLAVTSGRLIFKNISMNWTHNLWKFGEDKTTQTRMLFSYTWKSKKSIKIKGFSISYSHIWHVDKAKCKY